MTRAEILDKAKECVCGQREQDYGKPEDNFATIAALWGAYKDTEFSTEDVAVMMALMKIARIKTGTSTDYCFVNLAGYAACGGEIASADKKEGEAITVPVEGCSETVLDVCKSHDDACFVCRIMNEAYAKYGVVTIADFNNATGRYGKFGDMQLGWEKDFYIKAIKVRGDGAYALVAPVPARLKSNVFKILKEEN